MELIKANSNSNVDVIHLIVGINTRFQNDPRFGLINCGGCGTFAAYCSMWLNRYDIPFRIVAINNGDIVSNRSKLKRVIIKRDYNHSVSASAYHIMIVVNDQDMGLIAFDATSVHRMLEPIKRKNTLVGTKFMKDGYMEKIVGEYSPIELKYAIRTVVGWNPMWKRHFNPFVWDALKDVFKESSSVF
jgi:hypothetical protein